MKTAHFFFALALVAAICTLGCKEDTTVFCTEEFRTIGVYVAGGPLDDYYTERASNGQIIRPNNTDLVSPYHVVLDDSHKELLTGNTETFYFVGTMQGQEAVRATFLIGADACHIFKVSGPDTLNL